jgi:hypothetical protein
MRYFIIMLFCTAYVVYENRAVYSVLLIFYRFYTLYGTYLFTGALFDFLDKARVWQQTIYDEDLKMYARLRACAKFINRAL